MKREYHKWFSPNLHRDMELLVFGHAGARVLVFPTRAGRFFDYENWGLVHALRDRVDNGWLQLYCVDSVDAESFYCNWCRPGDRILRHMQYENYVLREVLPFSRGQNDNPFVISHGCSLGAFHATNLALRHPHLFGKIVALSGRYDLTISVAGFRSLFDDYYDENIYFNTPCHFVPNLSDGSIINAMRNLNITLAIGREDVFLDNNYYFSQLLSSKEIGHELHVWEGEAHRPRDWRKMVHLYM
jgi:esterase/lipase superfamily enzyme